jgi:hypothetical protein
MQRNIIIGVIALALGACGAGDHKASGQATYVRPPEQGGRPVASQRTSETKVTIALQGAGSFERAQGALCNLTSGDFSQKVESTGTFSGGSYSTSWSSTASGGAQNPLCGAVNNLRIQSLTSLTLTASIPANSENCDGYCQAKADVDCEASLDKASCISSAVASCKTSCQGKSRITGTGSASSSALAAANGKLGGSGEVEAQVNLVFTTLE